MLAIERVTAATEVARTLVGELEAVLSAEYPPEQRHGLALEAIFQPHIHFFVATLDGVPAGCGGGGVAQGLIARLAAAAGEHGYSVLRLETGDVQHAALRLYEREGFARCEAFGDYAGMAPAALATSIFMQKAI